MEEIYNFWFKELGNSKKWFIRGRDYDEIIRERYLEYWEKGVLGELDHWQDDYKSCLVLIIILDQFSRHINRNEITQYTFDKKTVKMVYQNMEHFDKYNFWEKVFFLMPLHHSENIEDHINLLQIYHLKFDKTHPNYQSVLKNIIKYYHIIKKYNRFPFRNKILNRKNTNEEDKYFNNY